MEWIDEFISLHFPLEWKDTDIEKAYLLKDAHLPKSLYKYREVNEYSIKNLKEDTVWLADPESFNDPYDCSHTTDYAALHETDEVETFRKYISDPQMNNDIPENIVERLLLSNHPFTELNEYYLRNESEERKVTIDKILKKIQQETYENLTREASKEFSKLYKLCSFSEINNSMLMWAHYANYHQGFCIEYDFDSLPNSDVRRRFLYPVVYSKLMFDATEYFKMNAKYHDINNLYISKSTLVKAEDWKYEKEWRLVFSGNVFDEERSYYMGNIKAIYLGAKILPDKKKLLLKICKEKGIKAFKMETSHNTFNLVSSEIKL